MDCSLFVYCFSSGGVSFYMAVPRFPYLMTMTQEIVYWQITLRDANAEKPRCIFLTF